MHLEHSGQHRSGDYVVGAELSPDSRGASRDRSEPTENQMRDLETEAVTAPVAAPKPKKKLKKVKLSFGDDEEM